MNDNAKYLIAQYVEDVFRMEPKNVGVIVKRGDEVAARFLGESPGGMIDGRRLRGLQYPDVYRQWVSYWRKQLADPQQGFDKLEVGDAGNYRLMQAGVVSDTKPDALPDVASYLYAVMVSEGGLAEALGNEVEAGEQPDVALRRSISDELASINILARGSDDELPLVPHPVRMQQPVPGTLQGFPHVPSFVQQNGLLFVMETVDFSIRDKERAKDHAGLASYMFEDLRVATKSKTQTIAVVRVREPDKEYESVRYGMAILQKEAQQVVNWYDDAQRKAFLQDRQRVAFAA